MKALTYIEHGKFALSEKPKPEILDPRDAVVRVTLGSICTSDLHVKHGSVPRAVPGITVGHEMVGVVESVGSSVTTVKPGDRVTVNVETFCGECFFCQHGFVNNCTDPNGGWALGCRIDGGQAEFVRVPYADQGLNKIPNSVTDEQALLVGDVLATGFWAARISEITEEDTVLIIGAGPTGLCTLMCVLLKHPKRIIVCEKDPARIAFVREHYPDVLVCEPENCKEFTLANSDHGGADVVLEVAGAKDTFRLAWDCARPNAIVTVVALYDEAQTLPLPDMYGKNLTFKTGGVDGCDCAEILSLIEAGKIDTTPLITHRYRLEDIEEAYHLFENKLDGVIKVAIESSIPLIPPRTPLKASDKLANICKALFNLDSLQLSQSYYYASLPLCIIDSVFSIGVRYTSTQNVVNRYCKYYSLPVYNRNRNEAKQMHTVSELVENIEKIGIQDSASTIFNNKQRTSSKNGILKAEAVYQFAKILKKYGIESFVDLMHSDDLLAIEREVRTIPGQTSGLSWRYFLMLAGDDNLAKPDRHILRFMHKHLGITPTLHEAQMILEDTVKILHNEYSNITVRLLDYTIWNYSTKLKK